MKIRLSNLFAIIAILALVWSCEKSTTLESEDQTNEADTEIPDHIIKAITELGYDTTNFPVEKYENHYIVEGDIIVPYSEKELIEGQYLKQRKTRSRLNCNRRRVRVKSNLNRSDTRRLRSAMNRWNKSRSGGIQFVLVSKNADVTVKNSNNTGGFEALAYNPNRGRPGKMIWINRNKINKRSSEFKIDLITHELGHVVGLEHTSGNANGSSHISGTPQNDRLSIMNSIIYYSGKSKITFNDKKGLNKIYERCR